MENRLACGLINGSLVMAYVNKEISGEFFDVSEVTVGSLMEPLREFKEYHLQDIWNMDEIGCFFKALLSKGLAQKGKKCKRGIKSKQRMTVAFFVSADGGKIDRQ